MAIRLIFVVAFAYFSIHNVESLENGLARTPPMGWLSWVALGCNVNCTSNPSKCVSQDQIMAMADRIVEDGFLDAGYQFVIIDDCWLAGQRDKDGRLQADPIRFSKGIKWLADYVHSRQLKFGIYEDYGTKTCAGYPGSKDHADMDAKTLASWGVDYLKLDGCYGDMSDLDQGYPIFRKALADAGRPIVYSCEWPFYTQMYTQTLPNYTAIRETCNVWRNWYDIGTSWQSIINTIDYFDQNQDLFHKFAGPGGWNDPDMLVGGNPGVTLDQAKVQMAIWSIWSAPLLMSVDLRTLDPKVKAVLQNKAVIAVDQDPLGISGRLVARVENVNIYIKPMTPVDTLTGDHSYAIAFLNRDEKKKATITLPSLDLIGLTHAKGYVIENLFHEGLIFSLEPKPNDKFSTTINPTGVTMYKATVVTG